MAKKKNIYEEQLNNPLLSNSARALLEKKAQVYAAEKGIDSDIAPVRSTTNTSKGLSLLNDEDDASLIASGILGNFREKRNAKKQEREYNYINSYVNGTRVTEGMTLNGKKITSQILNKYATDYATSKDNLRVVKDTLTGEDKIVSLDDYKTRDGLENMSAEEITTYNQLYAQSPSKAEAYLDSMQIEFSKRGSDKRLAEQKAKVQDYGKAGAAVWSAMSVPMNVYGGVVNATGQAINKLTGKEYNPYTEGADILNRAGVIRSTVNENLEGHKAAQMAYNAGMSAADNMLNLANASALGAGKIGTQILNSATMGAATFGSTVKELKDAGVDDKKITATGLTRAGIEAALEAVSLDALLTPKAAKSVIGALVKGGLSQAVVEGTTEGLTELATVLADRAILQKDSDTYQRKAELMEQGYSEAEAKKQVRKEVALQIAEAAGTGAMAGGAMGGVANVTQYQSRFSDNEQAVISAEVDKRTEARKREVATEQQVKELLEEKKKNLGAAFNLDEKTVAELEAEARNEVAGKDIDTSKVELDKKELKEIEKIVQRELEDGDIEISAIEQTVLKEQADEFNALKEEAKKATPERAEEIRARQTELKSKMLDIIKGDRYILSTLSEGYKRTQTFEREAKKNDTEQTKRLYESAVEAGMDNSRNMHTLFDLIDGVQNKSGTEYRFVNSKQLAKMKYTEIAQGVSIINRDDGTARVLINIDAKDGLETVVVHEAFHTLKGVKGFGNVMKFTKEFLETRGEYKTKYDAIAKTYESHENANLEEELTARTLAEHLSDEQFLTELARRERNVFQKLYDQVKHLFKLATAGSAEARKLEQMKHTFKKALEKVNAETLKAGKTDQSIEVNYNLSEDDLMSKINSSMTMQEAKDMLQRIYVSNDVRGYANAAEWLNEVGSEDVAMVLESDYALYKKYIESNEDILNEEYSIKDVLDAYLNGTLVGKKKEGSVRLDTSKDTGFKDVRFYAPQDIKGGHDLYNVANQRVTNSNRAEVYKARADFIINAHNAGYIESLGLTREEVNKKLKAWANYTKKAMDLSNSLNAGVSTQNRWAGIENSTILNTVSVSEEEMSRLVKSVEGTNSEWQRHYITSTMLALDTHIDYTNLSFVFDGNQMRSKTALGEYSDREQTIRIRVAGQNTVAHEMGHYLDHTWGRDLGYTGADGLTGRGLRLEKLNAEQKQFVKNFYNFLSDIENTSDLGSSYKMASNEVFARFVARFTEWTKNQATNNRYGYETKWYNDNFNERQYREFVKILQEKAMLDTTGNAFNSVDQNLFQSPTNANYDAEDIAEYEKPITAKDIDLLRSIGKKSVNNFSSDDIQKSQKWAYKFYKELGCKSPFFRAWFGDWREHDKNSVIVAKQKGSEYSAGKSNNSDVKEVISWGNDLKGETINHAVKDKVSVLALGDIRDIVENAVLLDTAISMPTSKTKMPHTAFMHSFYTLYKDTQGSYSLLKLFVEEALSNNQKVVFKRAYQLKDIQKIEIADIPDGVLSENRGLTEDTTAITIKIADLHNFVKQYDKDFKSNSVDPALLNADGTPKIFYHGTLAKDITEFKKDYIGSRYAYDETGFFFIDRKSIADDYATSEFDSSKHGKTMECYLQMSNPLVVDAKMLMKEGFGRYFKSNDCIDFWDSYQDWALEEADGINADGVIVDDGNSVMAIVFEPTQIKSATTNIGTFDKVDARIDYALADENAAPIGKYFGKDLKRKSELGSAYLDDIAPIRSDIPQPITDTPVRSDIQQKNSEVRRDYKPLTEEQANTRDKERVAAEQGDDHNVPMRIGGKALDRIISDLKGTLPFARGKVKVLKGAIQEYSTAEEPDTEKLYQAVKEHFSTGINKTRYNDVAQIHGILRKTEIMVDDFTKRNIPGYEVLRKSNARKVKFSDTGMPIDTTYQELSGQYPDFFPENITNTADQLLQILDVANMEREVTQEYSVDSKAITRATRKIIDAVDAYKKKAVAEQRRKKHSDVQAAYVDEIIEALSEEGMDFDEILENANNKSTFASVDNTPQRFMEKTFGYRAGQIINRLTINRQALNESKGIEWLNTITNRKDGLLAQLSKQYNIKPGSEESAAAQMYGEGFYVNDKKEYVKYGEEELKKDFPDEQVRANIIGLATDPRVRQFYDETLDKINESREQNGYPAIPKRSDYFLHFRAMDDTFSRLGIPFNPNDIKAKDLPTDLNGVTADLKPGQPYFASANQRKGLQTTYDVLGGMERYANGAKNQIYHIGDIQVLRGLRNVIASKYGQAKGLEKLDELEQEAQYEQIQKVYNGHLSNMAKFLNEQANIIAGKTALIDRGLEGIIGRRGMTVLSDINNQVGKNMVGFNIGSSLTNIISGVQSFAKTNKFDAIKAFSQTIANKFQSDGFTENDPFIIRRKGAEQFYRKPYQKISDTGYIFMTAIDDLMTEYIVRSKYNELTRKNKDMDTEEAHIKAGEWAARLLGDRSMGQMPHLFNSKTLGLFTKFQLEVRNQLDSMFYDTIQEAKAENEDIQNGLARNAKTAAKVTATIAQLVVFQHLFGKAFEAVAGYNPTFDILETIMTAFGFDDEEESEDTLSDNLNQAFLGLVEDLPYTSTMTGGRIPIASALPIEELITRTDDYGNEKPRWETLLETLPYYVMPGGYGQLKKTVQGLSMFDDDLPVSGSYTKNTVIDKIKGDSPGNLRFSVEDTIPNKIQAAVFGQWASQNARQYFDEELAPLKEKQVQEYIDSGVSMQEYWDYRQGLSGLKTNAEKADYIASLDLPIKAKNTFVNNVYDREQPIDMTGYDKFADFEEFDFATRYPEKYAILQEQGISVKEYKEKYEETAFLYTDDYSWASQNAEKYILSKAITDDLTAYKKYTSDLSNIKADKDSNGKTISGSAKQKKIEYINSLDLDYGQKIILYRSLFDSKADKQAYNAEIVEYLDSRDDISAAEMRTILEELDFNVDSEGNISW